MISWRSTLLLVKLRRLTIIFFLLLSACSRNSDTSLTQRVRQNIKNVLYQAGTTKHWKNEHVPIQKILDSLKINAKEIRIVIHKSAYELGVYRDTALLKNYPVVFGGNPVDDKLRRGDNCTPEGMFKIRSKYNHAKWSRFIWIDYPNADSWKKHNQAIAKGLIPKTLILAERSAYTAYHKDMTTPST